MNKKRHGQFFTKNNPFTLEIFREWFSFLPKNAKFLEPFAGANNIVKMINETFGEQNWRSFDIDPPKENVAKKIKVAKKDTLAEMPKNFDAIITNPPYLAKNSATRSGISWNSENKFDDLYKFSLEKMLENYDFVAAIIPESFITFVANFTKFREKLFATISLTETMFDDTEVPVCVALFVSPKIKSEKNLARDDFLLYRMENFLGNYNEIRAKFNQIFDNSRKIKFIFNDKNGIFGLRGVDGTNFANIKFVDGNEISPDKIKVSSRAITRIGVNFAISEKQKREIIIEANKILREFRETTNDVFLTSFKGLRKDGKYRRRLDFATAGEILDVAISRIIENETVNFVDLPIFSKLIAV